MKKTGVHLAAALVVAAGLAACGGGGGGDPIVSTPGPTAPSGGGGGGGGVTTPVGQVFEARLAPAVWHSLSSSDNGQTLVAGEAATGTSTATSFLRVSKDGGATWTAGTVGGIWIASDVSADGNHIAAVRYDEGGGIYVSHDGGTTFTPATGTLGGFNLGDAPFEGITISADGQRIAATIQGGPIVVSQNGGTTWALGAGAPTTAGWRTIDASSDGSVMVAVAQDPDAYISTDGGATWAPLSVNVGGAAVGSQNWYRVKVSGDGNTIAMAGNQFGGASGNGLYVSRDRGASFTQATTIAGDYSGIGMSNDGSVIGVTISNSNAAPTTPVGQVLLSTNGGTSFAPLAVNTTAGAATDTDWRAITISGDATKIVVAAGRFLTNLAGQLYVSTGARP
ncbi:sialidase family protein [Ramlibacter sp.]|uniref:WD40/YVTN/BNR-like repeat-containing protein n=1 Tax=Ramlibacter sp. TaxID=1917967 RepID=UPI002D7911A8|nr:sialidase family protein [Ramlibacter sp.]